MKRIVLDHFRRHAWLLVLCTLPQIMIEWEQAAGAVRHSPGVFGFFRISTAVFMSALLLSADLRRGIARAVGTLPLTATQLGRAWWLACVALPAVFLTLIGLGSALFHGSRPGATIPWTQLSANAIATLLTLDACFVLLTLTSWRADAGRHWKNPRNAAIFVLWVLLMTGGALLLHDLPDHPRHLVALLGIGTTVGALAWVRAEALVLGRTGYRPAPEGGGPAAKAHRPDGLGGLWLLLGQRVAFSVLAGVAMLLFIGLFAWAQKSTATRSVIVSHITRLGNLPFSIVLFSSFLPAIQQLRHLRTLPLSVDRLALVLLGTLVLPQLILGILVAILGGTILGGGTASDIVQNGLLTLAPSALWLALMAWRGPGMVTIFVAVLTTQFGAVWMSMAPRFFASSPGLPVLITVVALTVGFFLTRLALIHSSRAYRVPAGALAANPAWGTVR